MSFGSHQLPEELYDLTKKSSQVTSYHGHTAAMEVLKIAVAQATSLITPNPSALFHLEVTATARAISAVLSQERWQDLSLLHPELQGPESKYTA